MRDLLLATGFIYCAYMFLISPSMISFLGSMLMYALIATILAMLFPNR